MNSHEQYAPLLDAFIDGELSQQDADKVRAHLRTCPECRTYVEDVLKMRTLFPDVEETVVPDGFAASVMAKLPRRTPWKVQWQKIALPLAACIALAVFVRGTVWKGGGLTMGNAAPAAEVSPETTEEFEMDSAAPRLMMDGAENAAEESRQASESAAAGAAAVAEDDTASAKIRAAGTPAASQDSVNGAAEPMETYDTGAAVTTDALPEMDLESVDALPDMDLESVDTLPENASGVWTLTADAGARMDAYRTARQTADGIWYELTPAEFAELRQTLPDAGVLTPMDSADNAPPSAVPDGIRVFVPAQT